MTPLLQYLEARSLSFRAFGKSVGVDGTTISRIARGLHQPDWPTMEAIAKATDRTVMPNDFMRNGNGHARRPKGRPNHIAKDRR